MVHASVISVHINQLEKDIATLEDKFNFKPTKNTSCGSDCYCWKAGNHKVTNSLYHKDCIRMKKNISSITKTDVKQSQNRISEKKDVYHFGKAQVEVSLKKCSKDKGVIEGQFKNTSNKTKKFVNIGTDPITIVEPKSTPKRCWSAILNENAKSNLVCGESRTISAASKTIFDPPEKLQTISSSSSKSLQKDSQMRTVMVRDRGIQCHNSPNGISSPDLNSILPSASPINSLQRLHKVLQNFQATMIEKNEKTCLKSIISDMGYALEKLKQTAPAYSLHTDAKTDAFNQQIQAKDVPSIVRVSSNLDTLQETCQQLQSTSLKLEQTCQRLQKEKDIITEKFFEKSRELESSLKRELEYQAKLNEAKISAETMAKKLDQYTKSMEELSIHITRLQAENKTLQHFEEMKSKLAKQLMEANKENEKLNNELQLLSLEREKNKVLLDIKEQELNKLKSELRSIGGLVSEKMLETVMAGDSMMMSSQFDISESREIIISSPDGTIRSPSKSWKAVSSILSPNHPHRLLPSRGSKRGEALKMSTPFVKGEEAKKNPLETINLLKNELRELFSQMKKQTELPEQVNKEGLTESDISRWSTLTDSSDGYNSITENELSDIT